MTDFDIVREGLDAPNLDVQTDPFAALARIEQTISELHRIRQGVIAENERLRRIEEAASVVIREWQAGESSFEYECVQLYRAFQGEDPDDSWLPVRDLKAENQRLKVWLASERELRRRIEKAARDVVALIDKPHALTFYDECVVALRTALEEDRG